MICICVPELVFSCLHAAAFPFSALGLFPPHGHISSTAGLLPPVLLYWTAHCCFCFCVTLLISNTAFNKLRSFRIPILSCSLLVTPFLSSVSHKLHKSILYSIIGVIMRILNSARLRIDPRRPSSLKMCHSFLSTVLRSTHFTMIAQESFLWAHHVDYCQMPK